MTARAADGYPIWAVKSAKKLSNESSEDLERPPTEGTVALAVSTFTHEKRRTCSRSDICDKCKFKNRDLRTQKGSSTPAHQQPDSDRLLFQSAAERNKTVSLRLSAPAEVLQQRCAKQTKVDFPLLFLSFYFFYYYFFFLCVMVPGEKSEQQRRLHI